MIPAEQGEAPKVQFKKVQRRPVDVSALVEIAPEQVGRSALLAIRSRRGNLRLQDWAQANLPLIKKELFSYGALLFRNFGGVGVEGFEHFGRIVCSELFRDNGEHSRSSVAEGIYTPVFYAPEKKLLWHNENSFNLEWPAKVMFVCITPAQEGGETPIVDSRKVYDAIHPDVRREFIRKQVMYVRTYHQGLGLDWRTIFRTSSQNVVEESCRNAGMEYRWVSPGVLQTRCVRPSAVAHPDSGEMSWFNQALHWHSSCLDPEVRKSLLAMFPDEALPRNCFFGDGSRIEDAVIDHLRDVYQGLESSFRWQRGDVMLLDNILVAHARNAFVGERKLLVAMGEMMSYDRVQPC